MSQAWQRLAQDEHWRKNEFVISFPNEDSRGHLDVIPGRLHRSTCAFLSEKRRWSVYRPAEVETTTLIKFRRKVAEHSDEYRYDVCKKCCKDVVIVKPDPFDYLAQVPVPMPPQAEVSEAVLIQWVRDALFEKAWKQRRGITVQPEPDPKRKAVTRMRVSFDQFSWRTQDLLLTVECVPTERFQPDVVGATTAIAKDLRLKRGTDGSKKP